MANCTDRSNGMKISLGIRSSRNNCVDITPRIEET